MSSTRLAESSGIALIAQEGRLLVVDQGIGWTATAIFVLGLVGGILTINGLAQALLWLSGGSGVLLLGLIFTAAGLAALAGLVGVVRLRRSRRRQPPEALTVVAIFDLAAGELRDGSGARLQPLSAVRLVHRLQLSASAPSLAADWRGGSLILVRGNVFDGGISAVESALKARLPQPEGG
jgi:hypothetical protein